MKKIIITIFILVFSTTIFASKHFNVEKIPLENGANLFYLQNKTLPIVDINVVFNAGSIHDGADYGLATITASLLEEGMETADAKQTAQIFLGSGAQFSNNVDRLYTTLKLRSLVDDQYLNPALDNLNAIITKATFNVPDINRIKKQMQDAIKIDAQNPNKIAQINFYKLIYQGTPFAHNPNGSIPTLEKITQNKIKNFYAKYYNTANAKVIIVGDVSKHQAMKMANTILRNLPRGLAYNEIPEIPNNISSKIKTIDFPSTQTTVWMGQVGISRNDDLFFPFMVGNEILGGSQQNSMLFNTLRKKHAYVYSAYSLFNAENYKGPFIIVFQTNNSTAKQAISAAKNTLATFINDGASANQVLEAKNKLINGFYLNLATNTDLLNTVTAIANKNLSLDYLDNYQNNIRQVTKKNINAAFRKFIKPQDVSMVIVGKNAQQ
jgi:zinc protease